MSLSNKNRAVNNSEVRESGTQPPRTEEEIISLMEPHVRALLRISTELNMPLIVACDTSGITNRPTTLTTILSQADRLVLPIAVAMEILDPHADITIIRVIEQLLNADPRLVALASRVLNSEKICIGGGFLGGGKVGTA